MTISIIAAVAKNKVIGKGKNLPWHLPADLKHFKKLTLGKPVIMGQTTFESLPGKLKERKMIVLSNDESFNPAGVKVARSIDRALALAGDAREVMIAGGASVYKQFLPVADKMYLTIIDATPEGDVYFPEYDESKWREVKKESHPANDQNEYSYTFLVMERR